MLGFFNKTVAKLFGTKSDKDIKVIMPLVNETIKAYETIQHLSHDELRQKSYTFREIIQTFLNSIDLEIAAQNNLTQAENIEESEKEAIYSTIDKLKKKRDEELEKVLLQLLPEAFAVMKSAAYRFTNNSELVVNASDLDRKIATKKEYVRIQDDKAIWKNTWEAAGGAITWDMVHYDVQLLGGIVLHSGKIAEMATGEGKTLVATLPTYLNALSGQGVHLVTVNDYLARRDSEWMGPIFEFLGVTIDCIDKYQPHTPERRNAYLADITYGTNNEFGFDYLRDNMVRSPEEMVQRKLHFAMVDEVDSVLIDDARTPLIISGPIPKGDEQEFYELKPRISKLVDAQNKVTNAAFAEAKKQILTGKTGAEDGGKWLYVAQRGAPKNKQLITYLSEQGMKQLVNKAENTFIAEQQRRMPEIDKELYYSIDEKNNSVELTDRGIELITGAGEDANFFVIPDVGATIADIEKTNDDSQLKLQKKDEVLREFSIKSERIHTVNQLLKAYTMFERDIEYVVMEDKVKIVDEQTGRILDGRRYSDGLHQAIEAKENVKVEAATQTYATITLQNYFRMFHKLAGMTGTAETEAGEFWSIYELDVVTIPTNRTIVRNDKTDLIYKTQKSKHKAVIEEIIKLVAAGRPVLVGTVSVEDSELLSRMLTSQKIKHNVLNAKQHQREAQIVAEAGWEGNVTIATNMAGRGTDIKLSATVKSNGGLAIIGTERHESRRVDRQLRGRAGRQGDPGSSQFFVSMEDNLMRLFGSDRAVKLMDKMGGYDEDEVLESSMLSGFIENAQKKVEENNFGIRKRLLEYDDVMNVQRTRIYQKRQHALHGNRLSADVDEMIDGVCENIITQHYDEKDFEGFKLEVIRQLSFETEITKSDFQNSTTDKLTTDLYHEAVVFYNRKRRFINDNVMVFIENLIKERGNTIQNVMVPFTDGRHTFQGTVNVEKSIANAGKEVSLSVEKAVVLGYLDDAWKEHLRMMEDLKQAVQTSHLEQKDPLQIYKKEAYIMLENMVGELNSEILSFLFKAGLPQQDDPTSAKQQAEAERKMKREAEELRKITATRSEDTTPQKASPIKVEKKVGRNEACPCGSGKKYKNCHAINE